MVQSEKKTLQICNEEHCIILPLEEDMYEEATDRCLCNKHCHWLIPTLSTLILCQLFLLAFNLWLSSR